MRRTPEEINAEIAYRREIHMARIGHLLGAGFLALILVVVLAIAFSY